MFTDQIARGSIKLADVKLTKAGVSLTALCSLS